MQTKEKEILGSLLTLPFTHKFSCWNVKQVFPESPANDNKDITTLLHYLPGCVSISLTKKCGGSLGCMCAEPAVEGFTDVALTLEPHLALSGST